MELTIRISILALAFHLAMIGLLQPIERGTSLSLNQFQTVTTHNSLLEGNHVPNFPVYNAQGKAVKITQANHSSTVIISGCECQVNRLKELIRPALLRNETVSFIIQAQPSQVHAFMKKHALPIEPLAIRATDLMTVTSPSVLPIVVHLDETGKIIAVEH